MQTPPEASACVLSPPAFSALVAVLDDIHRPLGDLVAHLWDSPAAAATHLALGATIAALLQDDLLPKPPQRLAAIYILYDMIVSRHSLNTPPNPVDPRPHALDALIDSPLTIILFELADVGDTRLPEQLFLSHLLTHSQSAGPDASVPAQISHAAADTLWNALEDAMRSGAAVPKLNISSLRNLWTARHPDPTPSAHHTLPPISAVLLDPDPFSSPDHSRLSDDLDTIASLRDFVPRFVRPPPPPISLPTHSLELRWIDPQPLHELVWDPDMGLRGERGTELRDIIARALKSPLPEALQQRVITQLDADPKLVHLCGLTPQKLPDLVRNNSTIATKVLLKLMSSKQMPQYMTALVKMDMNLHSVEVFDILSSTTKLPPEYVHTYINNCIRSCGNIPDKFGQMRMVRKLCHFLKNLLKNKTIDVQDLFIEVQAFCIEYSRIREVADLFRSLKSYGVQQ